MLFNYDKELFDTNYEKLLYFLYNNGVEYKLNIGRVGELEILIEAFKTIVVIYKFENCFEQNMFKLGVLPRRYMLEKYLSFNSNGWVILQFFEDEISFLFEIVLSVLRNKLKLSTRLCGARNCSISYLDSTTSNYFLSNNHIHGRNYGRKIDIGAFYNGRLVGVMSFRKGNLSRNSAALEMDRFCTLVGHNIPGLASKMFKFFIDTYDHGNNDIVTYADLRFTSGNVYNYLGFEFDKFTQTNYFYIINGRRVHRFSYRKSVLAKKLKTFDPNLTEYQNMINNGIDRVWDCGHKKFIVKNYA